MEAPPRPLPDPIALLPAGAETLLVLRPRILFTDSAMRPVADALLPPDRRDAIERRRGVRVADLERLLIADYGEAGFIAIAVGVNQAPQVVQAIALGMNTVEFRSDEPMVRRTGYLGTQRRDVVALDDHTLLFAGTRGPLVAALLERARGGDWPTGITAAAAQPTLHALMDETDDEPLMVYVPRPLGLDPATGPGLLLSRQTGLALTLVSVAPDAVRVKVTIHGELPPSANENFRQWVESIGQSSLGAIVGIAEGLPTLRVEAEARRAAVSEQIPSQGLVRAIRLLLADRVGEALDEAFPAMPSPPPRAPQAPSQRSEKMRHQRAKYLKSLNFLPAWSIDRRVRTCYSPSTQFTLEVFGRRDEARSHAPPYVQHVPLVEVSA